LREWPDAPVSPVPHLQEEFVLVIAFDTIVILVHPVRRLDLDVVHCYG
jgi:hypothetical protein